MHVPGQAIKFRWLKGFLVAEMKGVQGSGEVRRRADLWWWK